MSPVSRKEESLWLLEGLVPDVGVNNIPAAFRAEGRLDRSLLERSLAVLVRTHRALRTVFTSRDGELAKEVLAPEAVTLPVVAVESSEDTLDADLTTFAAKAFELDGGPLLRAAVFGTEHDDVFCVVAHHLVFDAVSAGILVRELGAVHDALAAGGPAPAAAEAAVLEAPEIRPESLEFWRRHLDGFDASALELRSGKAEPVRPTLVGGTVAHDLSAEAVAVVRTLGKRFRAPEAVVLLAAYYLLLAGHGAGPDLVVGSPVNLRGQDTADAIGYHVNTMPLRVEVDPATPFAVLVRRTREVFFASLAHSDAPVDELLPEVARSGSSWRGSLFRHVFNYVPDSGTAAFAFGGTRVRPVPAEAGFSKHDLEFLFQASAEATRIRAVHYTEVLDHADVLALVWRYEALLLALGEDDGGPVGDIPLWSARDHEVVTAGRAAAGVEGFVADAAGRELPVGLRGELCLTGRSLPAGAAVDGTHPVLGDYARTGDAAWWRHDGTLEVLGRTDRRVRVRGTAVQLERIEEVLRSEPDVRAARVVFRPDDEAPLVAFVQAVDSAGLADRLGKLARAELPLSVVPDEFVLVDVLPEDDRHTVVAAAGHAGDDALVGALVGLWEQLLDRTDVTARSNFFESGGHSLLAAKLAKESSLLTGVRLRLADVFANPTPLTLAGHLRAEGASL